MRAKKRLANVSGRTASLLFLALAFTSPKLTALDNRKELSRYGRQTWQTESGLPQNTVHAILQTRDGYIWLGTEGGVVRFDGLKFVVYDTQNTPELRSNNIRSLLEDREGTLWIGTADGLTKLKSSEFSTFTVDQGLPNNSVWSVHEDRVGGLWVTTADGVSQYRGGRFVAQSMLPDRDVGAVVPDDLKRRLPSKRIVAVYEDKEGTLWVSTDRGVARIIGDRIDRFAPNDFLSGSLVLSFYEDREGNLWLGTESEGLTVLRDQKFITYTDDLVRCAFQDRTGTVWLGTNSHGVNRFENHKFSSIGAKDGLSSDVILALADDSEGNVLIGTPDGLNVLRNGRNTILTSAEGLADDFVRSIYKDLDDSLWIGTRRGLSHWSQGKFTTYTQADGLGSDLVGALLRDARKNLWVATLQGLTRFSDGKFKNYTVRDGLSSNVITALYEDSAHTLWIGTQGGGLNRFRDDRIAPYPSTLGLPGVIYGILEDAHANLWLASKTGIVRVSKKDLNRFAEGQTTTVTLVTYGTADGLRVSECTGGGHPAAWKNKDGTLWFATLKGVAVIDPEHAKLNLVPPPVVLESVTIDDQAFEPAKARDLPAGHTRFAFEYAGLSFVSPHTVRFKYKLEGFDRNWIDAGTWRVAYYTNISPGRYRFRVSARNNDGVWNESGASFAFRLRPHFYQTYWFDFLIVMALALLAYEIYRWRVRQVEAQFRAVLNERNRIAREIHDTLAQGFVAVSVQLELIARMLSISTESAREQLKVATSVVQNSLSEARRSIWELRSQRSENEDLPARLSHIVQQVTSTSGVKVDFQVVGAYRPLPGDIENELIRIAQEALANVVRHADAKQVSIDLNFQRKKLRMTIADDGRGFTREENSSGPDGHFGLKGMQERADQIDAELIVKSAPGHGTQVSVERVIH
jgi:signal transduction histidine kinase/ligand-binding sensor domain-containing protein